MLQLALKLQPDIEKTFIETVKKDFDGSYEKFVEVALKKHVNVLSKLSYVSEDLGVDDLAQNHDHYIYGTRK